MDKLLPSQNPPKDIPIKLSPQFVSIGFDDNGYAGLDNSERDYGITWVSKLFSSLKNPAGSGNKDTYDGASCTTSFYYASFYSGEKKPIGDNKERIEITDDIKIAWNDASNAGHEAGNHTHTHPFGHDFSVKDWEDEIEECFDHLARPLPTDVSKIDNTKGPAILRKKVRGFRAPYLDYNDNLFTALKNKNIEYDCSIEEGWQKDQDGKNFLWPYTLDAGSPGHNAGDHSDKIGSHDGVWEMPLHVVITPPDDKCEKYGIPTGFRKKLKLIDSSFDISSGKITALDWNVLVDFKMSNDEYLATLKYTLDLRVEGNRAPFMFGAHSDVYSPKYDFPPNISWQERQDVISEFLKYALSKKEVRVVSLEKILDWVKDPKPLG